MASSADGIPLHTFTPAGAQAVVSLFAIWGLAQLIICLLCILALVRYRSIIPFMFVLLLLDFWPLRRLTSSGPTQTVGARRSLGQVALEKAPFLIFVLPTLVFVSMPFGPLFSPSLALSLLQPQVHARGLACRVEYFTLAYAERRLGRKP